MWMAHYNHPTPKRTLLVSNRREIALLGKGKLRGAKRHAAYKTAVQYRNRQGKRCYQGTPLLKQTQFLANIVSSHSPSHKFWWVVISNPPKLQIVCFLSDARNTEGVHCSFCKSDLKAHRRNQCGWQHVADARPLTPRRGNVFHQFSYYSGWVDQMGIHARLRTEIRSIAGAIPLLSFPSANFDSSSGLPLPRSIWPRHCHNCLGVCLGRKFQKPTSTMHCFICEDVTSCKYQLSLGRFFPLSGWFRQRRWPHMELQDWWGYNRQSWKNMFFHKKSWKHCFSKNRVFFQRRKYPTKRRQYPTKRRKYPTAWKTSVLQLPKLFSQLAAKSLAKFVAGKDTYLTSIDQTQRIQTFLCPSLGHLDM